MKILKNQTVRRQYNIKNKDIVPSYKNRYLYNLKKLKVGAGDQRVEINKNGIFVGGDRISSSPFSVNMLGDMTASSVVVSGYIPTGGAASDVNSGATSVNASKIGPWGTSQINKGTAISSVGFQSNGNFKMHIDDEAGATADYEVTPTEFNVGGKDIKNVNDYYQGSTQGLTSSISHVISAGDTIAVEVKGGIITSFTIS